MSRRPLIAMSIAYLLLLFAAYGTGSLWPVYIARLGGGPSAAGIFNAAGAMAIVPAALLSGWLADRTGRRRELLYAGCILFAITWWLMSRATTWQQLTLVNILGGFAFGIATNLIIIMTGLLAGETERGRSFGLLTFMVGASLLLGGLACGPIADRWGFPTLLGIDALICLLCLLPGLFFVEPAAPAAYVSLHSAPDVNRTPGHGLGRGFYLLTSAAMVATLGAFGGNLGRSIAMNQLGFSATAISLTTAIGGAVNLPAPLVMGWLSDHIGRKRLLLLCTASGFGALLALAFAGSNWGFWGASVLLALMMSSQPLTQALVTDMLPARSVGAGLSLLSGATSAGILCSSLGIGAAIQQMGARPAFLIAALTPLITIALILPVREPGVRSPLAKEARGDVRAA